MTRSIDLESLEQWLPPREPARERVMDAFEEAILVHGVHGASFARIAEEGGFHRTLVQHHFKSRSTLIESTIRRIVDVYFARMAGLLLGVAPEERLDHLLDWLMSPFGDEGPVRQASVVDAFIALASTDEAVRAELRRLYDRFAEELGVALKVRAPELDEDTVKTTAFALVCLSFGRAGLDTLGTPLSGTLAAREACRTLVENVLRSTPA